jgi:1,4-dihydroxy-2-naphthoate octaprenyltransferase
MLQKSTIQLVRFHFSLFLLPVYLFALSQVVYTNWYIALLIFFILHGLVYPASNGYNSFEDRDKSPIGGIRFPLQPTNQLRNLVIAMDLLSILLGMLVSSWFAAGIALYILASRMYSNRITRIKKYPVAGFLLVVLCQGALIFWMVYHGSHKSQPLHVPITGCIASSLLIAGAYPLTQVYQHEADSRDGIKTISMLVGIRGTFILSALLFTGAFMALGLHFALQLEFDRFMVLLLCFMPVLIFFLQWAIKTWRDPSAASFDNLMKMNIISAICSNTGFLIILIWKFFD